MKCHYCDNEAVQCVQWLQDKFGQPKKGKLLPHCGCDLREALKRFWSNPYPVYEGKHYEIHSLE